MADSGVGTRSYPGAQSAVDALSQQLALAYAVFSDQFDAAIDRAIACAPLSEAEADRPDAVDVSDGNAAIREKLSQLSAGFDDLIDGAIDRVLARMRLARMRADIDRSLARSQTRHYATAALVVIAIAVQVIRAFSGRRPCARGDDPDAASATIGRPAAPVCYGTAVHPEGGRLFRVSGKASPHLVVEIGGFIGYSHTQEQTYGIT